MNPQDVAERIRGEIADLADRIVELHFARDPQLARRYGLRGRLKCLEDTSFHLHYLAGALESQRPVLFVDYVEWARTALDARGIPAADLTEALRSMQEVLAETYSDMDDSDLLDRIFEHAVGVSEAALPSLTSYLDAGSPTGQIAERYLKTLLEGRRAEAVETILSAVASGISVKQVYLEIFRPVQYEVGRLWQLNAVSVAQEHFCSAVTQMAMSRLYAEIFSGEKNGMRLVAACVAGDLHEIGLRSVADIFEIEGWDTFYAGANTPTPAIVETVISQKAHLLALAATMTYHVGPLKSVVAAMRAAAGGDKVRVLVGGRPFLIDPTLVDWVGADGTAADAEGAVQLAEHLVQNGK